MSTTTVNVTWIVNITDVDVVTFRIDVDHDGQSDDNLEKTLPDIKEFGSFLNKKNTHLFFGGGIHKQSRLTQ